ncbi:MAG TPA: tyrosine-protein phosphatase [Polyangiales bacterium]|nr:tyrosine-protein phosphatase [Polyangiales bacterium]
MSVPESEPGPQPEPEPSAAAEPAQVRTVLAGHVENARDLGGIALRDSAKVKDGLLFRGPPLAALGDDGCAAVAELGIRSVIDLRVESEVSLKPDDACVSNEAQLLAAPLPVPYNVSPADYIAVLDTSESIVRIFEVLGDEARYPVYFHCTWGRDRTGIMSAVVLLALGATPEAIMEDYLVSDETVGAYPASLRAALEEIASRGGIDAYLAAAGVSAQQLATLRSHAIWRATR